MPRPPPPGLTESSVKNVLAELRRDLDERFEEAHAALEALKETPEDAAAAMPLRKFFHSIAGLLPMLGYRELGFIAKTAEETLKVMEAQAAPGMVPLLDKSFVEVHALLLEATDGIQLPAVPLAQLPDPPLDLPTPGSPRGNATLLVVDDDAASAQMVRVALSNFGYRVVVCTAPSQVPALLEREEPELVILDVFMPTLDGFELCQRIRSMGRQNYIPILFLSATDAIEDRVKGLQVGGDDFLKKPFEQNELAARVHSHLKRVATMREMSLRDALTRAYNRRYFDERLRHEVHRSERNGAHLSLAMLDIDFFKSINDHYGHPAGDAVLVQTVQILGMEFRSTDVLSRYGGEEFALILLDTGLEAAHRTVARACSRVAITPMTLSMPDKQPLTLKLTLSGGVASFKPGEGHERLLDRADKALYAAKSAGRNRVVSDEGLAP